MQTNYYHGTRVPYETDQEIPLREGFAYFTTSIDAAIWDAERAEGDDVPRVYEISIDGSVENAAEASDYRPLPHPSMTLRSRHPLKVRNEVTTWRHFHGTRADLRTGDLIEPGFSANFGPTPRLANFVYFTRTLDAAIWGAELAVGDSPERIYVVEPTGEYEDDPNLTNMKFRGNPTKSFRSRAPLRVVGELSDWTPHPPELVRVMRENLARLNEANIEPNDDALN